MVNRAKRELVIMIVTSTFLLGTLEALARKMYPSHMGLASKIHRFKKRAHEFDGLILGNSHAEKGIDPDSLPGNFYNMAFSSQDVYYDKCLLDTWLEAAPKPRWLVLGVSYFSFGFDESKNNRHLVKEYMESGCWPRNGLSLKLLSRYSLFYTHRQKFLKDLLDGKRFISPGSGLVESKMLDKLSPGEYPANDGQKVAVGSKTLDWHLSQAPSRARHHKFKSYDDSVEPQNLKLYKQIIEKVQKYGVKPLLVVMPVSKAYKAEIGQAFLEQFQRNLDSIKDASNGKLLVLDLNTAESFELDQFFDADHLNLQGSKKASGYLGTILKN